MMKVFWFRRVLVATICVTWWLIAGCSSDEPGKTGEQDQPQLRISAEGAADSAVSAPAGDPYEGWTTYTYENFRIHYPPEHPRADLVMDMAKAYAALARRDAQFFRLPPVTDTVEVYFYTGVGQGRRVTGSVYPIADSAAMHVWLPSDYGPNMAKFMIRKWGGGAGRHEFIEHGLVLLLDYTGRNHHKTTMELRAAGTFVPLAELAADTAFTSDTDPNRAAEAASFVDFVVFTKGVGALRAMYTSPEPFAAVARGVYGTTVDSLEGWWLSVAERAVTPEKFLDSLRADTL